MQQSEEILFPTKSLAIRVTLVWAHSACTTVYTPGFVTVGLHKFPHAQ